MCNFPKSHALIVKVENDPDINFLFRKSPYWSNNLLNIFFKIIFVISGYGI